MNILSNKGFLLVETLVVTVFVMTMFIFLYRNSIPMVGEYERREVYDDIDSIYAANEVKKLVTRDANFPNFISSLETTYYKDITSCSLYADPNYCNVLKTALGINDVNKDKILIVDKNLTKVKSLVSQGRLMYGDGERGIREYLLYLPVTSSNSSGYDRYYILISRTTTTYENKIRTKYANIEVIR